MREGRILNNPATKVAITSNPLVSSTNRTNGTTAWENDQGVWLSKLFGTLVTGAESDYVLYPFDGVKVDRLARLATIDTWKNLVPPQSQSLVTWAEAHKTWDTLYKRAKQLADVVTAVRKGDVKRLERLMPGKRTFSYPKQVVVWDNFSDIPLMNRNGNTIRRYARSHRTNFDFNAASQAQRLWLEYRYGWSPMVYDIVDTLKATYAEDLRLSRAPRPFLTCHGKAQDKWSSSAVVTSSLGGIGSVGTRQVDYGLIVRGYILYRCNAGRLVQRLNDFGLFDVPRAIWELVPLSFVVDWFVPVGDYLGAIQPKVGVEILASGNTALYTLEISQWLTQYGTTALPNQGWSPLVPIGAKDLATIDRYVRNLGLGTPFIPPLAVNLTAKRLVDAAALISGMRR